MTVDDLPPADRAREIRRLWMAHWRRASFDDGGLCRMTLLPLYAVEAGQSVKPEVFEFSARREGAYWILACRGVELERTPVSVAGLLPPLPKG